MQSLKLAGRLYSIGRFSEVIKILERKQSEHRDDFFYFYLIGMSCLHTTENNLDQSYSLAMSYLKRAIQLNPEDVSTLLGLAAAYILERNTKSALHLWFKVLEIEPKNLIANRALESLRNSEKNFYSLIKKRGVRYIVISPRKLTPFHVLTIAILAITAIGFVAILGIWFQSRNNEQSRIGSEHIAAIEKIQSRVDYQGAFRYIFTDKEIGDILNNVSDYFHSQRDNLVQREINRLVNSNLSFNIKQRLNSLSENLTRLDFTNFKDNFSPSEIIREPWLYNGCYVRWKGRVANVRTDSEHIIFDLLVGYQEEQELDIVSKVILPFAIEIENGMSIEIIGRVLSDTSIELLEGVAVRKLST